MHQPISRQVVVITGASSGIGRETAVLMARRGASVVLAARNADALNAVADEIRVAAGKAHVVVTDVADPRQIDHLADEAVAKFGRIDTWVNNAAVSEYATFDQMTDEEFRRIVDVNLMGPVYGTRAAVRAMRPRGGGTVINVGSVLSDRAVPLQSAYVATKHALKGFTDAVRMELQREDVGINITLILPASINTPFFEHARSRMQARPKPIPPVYQPSVVAEAILYAAEHKVRELYAGGFGKFLSVMNRISPRLVDWYMTQGGRMFRQQKEARAMKPADTLMDASQAGPGAAHGRFDAEAHSGSAYTRYLDPHPALKGALLGIAVIGFAAALVGAGRVSKSSGSASARRGRGVVARISDRIAEFRRRRANRDPREPLIRHAYVPLVKALIDAGISPREVPEFDKLQASFLDRLEAAAAKARFEAKRSAEEAEKARPARRGLLGWRSRRDRSRGPAAFRSGK